MSNLRLIKIKVLLIACLFGKGIIAQDLSYSKPGATYYKELPNPATTNLAEWSKVSKDINVSYGSDNIKYPKEKVPLSSTKSNWNARAWKGEKVHTQILIWTKVNIPAVSFQVSDLVSKNGSRITSKNVKPAFVRYVMSDVFDGGCSQGPQTKL